MKTKKLLVFLLAFLTITACVPQTVYAGGRSVLPAINEETEIRPNAGKTPRMTETGHPVGDVNGDGAVDKADLTALSRYLSKWGGIGLADTEAADIDRENGITAADRMILARYLAEREGYDDYFLFDPDPNEGPMNPDF